MGARLNDTLLETFPFVIGYAIRVAIEEKLKFGREYIKANDNVLVQLYQAMFLEVVGLKVDKALIKNWLRRYSIRDCVSTKVNPKMVRYFQADGYKNFVHD